MDEIDHRFRLLEPLGKGGMGVVYRALDRLTGECVALKKVTTGIDRLRFHADTSDRSLGMPTVDEEPTLSAPGSWEASPPTQSHERFALAREFQTLSSLRHPNIISVLDYGFDRDRRPYFTMELVERPKTFLEAVRGESLLRKVVLLAHVLRALSYLHRRNILHRDLKPANVLVKNEAKVVDFGLAIRGGEHGSGWSGTSTHVAPEVLDGGWPSEASDLYAVGIMMYEALAGHHPFAYSATRREMLQAHLVGEPDYTALEVNEELVATIRGLLHKDPRQRPKSADEVIEQLSNAVGIPLPRETRATRESFLQAAEFVDRIEERKTLFDALSQVEEGKGGLYLVEGQSGLGKSRLLEELRTEALVRGVTVVTGHRPDHPEAYHLWQEPLRRLALGTPLSDEEAATLKVLVRDLGTLIERPLPDLELNPQTAKDQVLAVIQALFQRQTEPLLVVLEDLHWARDSLDVLQPLLTHLDRMPVLIVGSYRGEEAVGLADELPGAVLLRLEPLRTNHISELTRSMLGHRGGEAEIVKFLEKHTEGNTFFIVETVRALAEEAGELAKISEAALPDHIDARGIEAVVERRLSLVPEKQWPLVEWSAILGRELEPELLASERDHETVQEFLATLADLALVEMRDNAWRFSHDRFREAVLKGLSGERARSLHEMSGTAIEAIYGGTKEHAASLAYHYRQAGNLVKETEYSAIAGQAALERGAYRDATQFLERALALQPQLEAPDPNQELDLLLNLGSVLIATRGFWASEVRETYERALDLGQELGRDAQVSPGLMGLCKFYFLHGQLEAAKELARRCLEIAESSDDRIARQHARLMIGESSFWCGDFARDRTYVKEILELYEPEQASQHLLLYGQNPRIYCMTNATIGTFILGYADEALGMSEDVHHWAEEEEDPFSRANAHLISGWLRRLRGDVTETLYHARQLGALAGESQFPLYEVVARLLEGWALAKSGEVDTGVEKIRQGFSQWANFGARLCTTFYTTFLADACLQAGLTEEGLAAVNRALDGSLETEEQSYRSELERLRGELLLQAEELEQAEAAFDAALRVAAEQEAKSFELRTLISLVQSPLRHRHEEVLQRLEKLCRELSEHGETPDLEQARAVLTDP